jgi:hypothetical protein
MNLGCVREETNTNRVYRSIAPSLVEETTRPIQMVEVSRILLAPEELHISDFEVGPEMAGRITISSLGVLRAKLVICEPVHHIVVRNIGGICGKELLGLGPKRWDTLRSVEKIDGETVCDIVVGHVTENVVVHVTEELDLGLDSPVVTVFGESGVLVEQATIPAAHLVVGDLVTILDILLLQDLRRLLEEIPINPLGDIPVLLGNQLCRKTLEIKVSPG